MILLYKKDGIGMIQIKVDGLNIPFESMIKIKPLNSLTSGIIEKSF